MIVSTTPSRRIRCSQFAKCVSGSRSLENTLSESSITTTRSTVLTQGALIGGNCGSQLLLAKPYFLDTLIDFVQTEALLKCSTCDHQKQGELRLFYPHAVFNMGGATHSHILFFPWCNRTQWAWVSSLQGLHDHTQTHQTKGRFTHSMTFPCHAHTIPLPCRDTKGLECVFPI